LDSTLSPLFLGQLKNLHKSCLVQFRKEMLEGLTGEEYNFADVVKKARGRCEGRFKEGAAEALVEGTEWSWVEELELLKEEAGLIADQCRKDETKKMINLIERNFKRQVSEPVDMALNKASPDMWDQVLKTFRETLDKAESTYLTKAKSFNCTEEENTTALATLQKLAWLALRAKIDEQTADAVILAKLRGHFEERFRYDEHGIPRVWKPDDDIDGAFKKAKDQTLELIPLYSKITPVDPSLEYSLPSDASLTSTDDEFDFPSTLIIFTETKALDLTNKFRRDADAYYVEAKRSTVLSVAQIPYWMYGVLVVLGWNEAMIVLFNPLYFAMLLVGLAAAYMIIKLHLVGPLFQITQTIGGEVHRQATNRLREHFSQPALAEPVRALSKENDRDDVDDEFGKRRPAPM
jgi:hypothetical protein